MIIDLECTTGTKTRLSFIAERFVTSKTNHYFMPALNPPSTTKLNPVV
jgi:hypothetical protein